MYIAPDSTIELFRNLKLDNGYANTMWFVDVTAQNTFFTTHYYLRYNSYTYQRKDIGVVRIGAPISSLYAVDYMRFKNTLFENKWFYAFVTSVEYINNDTTAIHYVIDVIQTYMFDWTLEPCLIERQHSVTDVAGDNLIPEGLELGDYIANSNSSIWKPLNYAVLFGVGCDYTWFQNHQTSVSRSYYAQKVSGLYSAVGYFIVDAIDVPTKLNAFITQLQTDNMIGAITSVTMIPTDMGLGNVPYSYTYSVLKPTKLNGYTPVNKKLYTYPYCYLDVYNDQTEHQEFRYELFSTSDCKFTLYLMLASTPEAIIYAKDYNNSIMNPDYSLSISGFPQVSYYNDSYKAWQALNYDQMAASREISAQQNLFNQQGIGIAQRQLTANTLVSEFQQGANVAGRLLKGDIAGALSSGAGMVGTGLNYGYESQKNDLASSRSEYDQYSVLLRQSADESRAKKLANTPHAGTSSMAVATDTKGFWCNWMSIRSQYAERIDKYFTMFGYAQNIVGTPNIHARQYFTYVKTVGSCVSGLIPQDDRETIDTIFDRGIRFWTDYSKFEDYSVNNAILT